MKALINRLNHLAYRLNRRAAAATLFALLAAGNARANTFDFSQVDSAGSTTGLGGFISAYGNTGLLVMVLLGILGVCWIGVELMFFDKEIRDVKKGLIGFVILVVAPAIVYLGMSHSSTIAAATN